VARSANVSAKVFADFHADVGEGSRVLRPAVISAASCSVRGEVWPDRGLSHQNPRSPGAG
jgi:hypothetical protein